LALKTILEASGYGVDAAATPSEAMGMLDECEYELVISDSAFGSQRAGRKVLAYARVKDYHPATALIKSCKPARQYRATARNHRISIYTENLPGLLLKVAELIGFRASRRYRALREPPVSS